MWTHLRSKHQTEFRNATESREKAEQAVKKRKLAEAEKAAVYVNGTPKLAVFLDKKEKYKSKLALFKVGILTCHEITVLI